MKAIRGFLRAATTLATLTLTLGAGAAAAAQDDGHSHDDGHDHGPGDGHVHDAVPELEPRTPWSEEVIELASRLPVQDGGRVKPLSTYASFTLLRVNGKRSLKTADGQRLKPIEWMLDVLFRPEHTDRDPIFLVQNDEVIEAIGLGFEDKKKRDRYSFLELRTAIPRLFELAHQYGSIESKNRSSLQQQLVFLAESVNTYMGLSTHMDFARTGLRLDGSQALMAMMDGRPFATYHELLARMPRLMGLHDELRSDPERAQEQAYVANVLRGMAELAAGSTVLSMFPPSASIEEDEEWKTPADLLERGVVGMQLAPAHEEMLASMEAMALATEHPQEFTGALRGLGAQAEELATSRGEYGKIDLEISYYKAKLISTSLYLFVFAFLTTAFSWLRPRGRILYSLTWAAVVAATGLLIGAIVMRCIIRGRPPVSTLYETVLFVTAVGCLVVLFMEAVNRQRLALSAGAILGMVGLFLANGYEVLDKSDTMPSLVAVLDTNFWLATHVTAITIGYSAGMLAALLASIYLIAKAVGVKRGDRTFYRNLGRMVYGVLCFGLFFSLVGTVLGGIWANDSWGRFWGWDPKENGALLIVLSQILILHGRMGGFLREHGVCMAAAFGGTVVAFSWWGVNLLGVGLHSYGFTSGIARALWTYYAIQWGVVGVGAWTWLRIRAEARRRQLEAAGDSGSDLRTV